MIIVVKVIFVAGLILLGYKVGRKVEKNKHK